VVWPAQDAADDADRAGGDCLRWRGLRMSLMKPGRCGPARRWGSFRGERGKCGRRAARDRGAGRVGLSHRLFPHALDRGPLNYAGTVENRVADLHAAYADPEVDAIICTRGGWGCAELLPHLDRELISANNKALLGYSDVTSLHVWLNREMGRVSFQAPMVASDFSKDAGAPDMVSWVKTFTQQHRGRWELRVACACCVPVLRREC